MVGDAVTKITERGALPLLVGVLLLGAGLGAYSLNADPLWYDEYRSFFYAGWGTEGVVSPAGTIDRVASSDVQAPGYFLLLNLWGTVAGRSVFAARVFSWLFGVLGLALAYRLATDLDRPVAGIAAALTLGVSAFYVVYTHEARTYSLLVVLVLLALWSYWWLVTGGMRPGCAAAFGLSMTALPYAHYIGALLFPALGLYHLLLAPVSRRSRRWWAVTGLAIGAGALFLPWGRVAYVATATRVANREFDIAETLGLWGTLQTLGAEYATGGAVLLVAVILLAAWQANRARRYALAVLALFTAVFVGFDAVVPVLYHPRYLIILWGPLAVVAGLGLAQAARLGLPLALVLAVWVAFGIVRSTDADYRNEINGPGAFAAWDTSAEVLANRAQPGDMLLLHLPYSTLYDFYHENISRYYIADLGVYTAGVESLRFLWDADYTQRGLAQIEGYPRVWYGYDPTDVADRHGLFENALREVRTSCPTPSSGPVLDTDAYYLELFVDLPPPDDPFTFGDGVRTLPLSVTNGTHDTLLPVTLGWWVDDDVAPHTYSAAVHLLDADGVLVAQADYGLPGAGANCRHVELDVSAVPPGDYRLTAHVYAWETGERLSADGDNDDRVELGWVVIE